MYIGTQPYSGIRARHTYTATAGQTSFSGAGAENVTLTYSDELYIDVYQNGVKLSPADYTATSGTTVVLGTAATVSDIVEVIKYDAFSVADTVSAKDGGGFGGNISTSGTLAVTGTSTFTGAITSNAGVVVDEMTLDGDTLTATDDLTLDVAGNINLDADGGSILLKDGGTQFGLIAKSSDGLGVFASVADKDIFFKGTDGSTAITALQLDMSAAGEAKFNDNIVMGTANKGIHLGVTSATASNLLDDYEEGTWTPTVETATGYNQQYGEYVKVGKMVYLGFDIRTNGVSAAGNELNGFPFTVSNSNAPFGAVNVGYYSGLTTAVVWISGYVRVNASGLYFTGNSNGHTGTTIQHNTFNVFNADTRILGHVVYMTT